MLFKISYHTNMKKEILKKHFGFDSFRPIQEEAIDCILEKKDVLTILPTGSGKSLIFQLPTLMMDGVTVVISPLIALMQDQIINLNNNGIRARMISSQNSNEENHKSLELLQSNTIQFLYIAPERFSNEVFKSILKKVNINFFVIDEAHCVSEWGHEFRDDYRKLASIKDDFPYTPIAAFTATATTSVQNDILQTLKIQANNLLKGKIQRDNLLIRSEKRLGNGKAQIVEFLKSHQDECGIVYCFSRKETEQLSQYLNTKGFQTLAYHAGLNPKDRDKIFTEFKNENIKIIVATIAFGMGIDKGNIRFVLHTSMPKTLENYSQEIGRAGRDGLKSEVLLLYSKSDEINKKRFIDELQDGTYKTNSYKKLEMMYLYAISSKCRHQFIAKYFDDKIDECKIICDNCMNGEIEYQDITTEAQKFLSTILRTEQRFGQNYIVDVLRGSVAQKILGFGHDKLSVHGIGADFSKEQWGSICDRLLDLEAISIQGEYRTLIITNNGKEILKGKTKVQIDSNNLLVQKSYDSYQTDIKRDETFEKFRELRNSIAKDEGMPPYIVFSDKTLGELAKKLPNNDKEFLSILGVGEQKLEKYGAPFIALANELRDKGVKIKKDLSQTYLDTLHLIQDSKTLQEIANTRELTQNTIIKHIDTLHENDAITDEKKEELIEPLISQFPSDLKEWIEVKLQSYDIKTLRENLALYDYIFKRD
jgi:ATP-dependent DNA helicase RecQ